MNIIQRMTNQEIAELISLFLTTPTIVLGIVVLLMWGPSATQSIANRSKLDGTQWFILGVTIRFLGQVLDNAYWGLAWADAFITGDHESTLFKYGVYPNIFSRQLCGTLAAYCHIKSALLHQHKDPRKLISGGCAALFILSVVVTSAIYLIRD